LIADSSIKNNDPLLRALLKDQGITLKTDASPAAKSSDKK
jgi:hypothetical protein